MSSKQVYLRVVTVRVVCRQDQDAGKSTALLLAIVGAIIGTLFWRSRKASKEVDQGPSTSHAKVQLSCFKFLYSSFVLWECCVDGSSQWEPFLQPNCWTLLSFPRLLLFESMLSLPLYGATVST